ncbi:hypothetical protein AGDE_02797 [Angomonas deanei]|nr:hypothetical protein AGDE_04354 [Angomonas deanei]EPY41128.1 hypothetical protein AGDE_02797 [Angomonas deanei]|eukprot:EPY39574.1 hypothetical protein AGDE_04354 [Angomonas deanei]
MFFDDFGGPQVTRTNFKATVSESEPYDFSLFTSQDVNTSVKLSQLVYTPPASVEEFNTYYEGKGQQPPAVEKGNVISVAAKIKGFTSNNKLETFTIAAFALDPARLQKSAEKKSSAKTPTDAILSDVAHNLKILLDIDGSVEFLVEGPGSVVFYGEQLTTLVSNGRPGDDSDSENQGSDMSEGELDEMFRLSRR